LIVKGVSSDSLSLTKHLNYLLLGVKKRGFIDLKSFNQLIYFFRFLKE